jgi:hypothetical protein
MFASRDGIAWHSAPVAGQWQLAATLRAAWLPGIAPRHDQASFEIATMHAVAIK